MDTHARFALQTKNDPLRHLSIGVLYGGPSAEREVSLQSGEAVAQSLVAAGRDVHRVILDASFNVAIARSLGIDVAFLALHGEFGEDGRLQMILEEADIPYIGSGPDASALAFDKILAKRALEDHGVLTPAWMGYDRADILALGGAEALDLVPPVVIKPATSGSSLGVSIVRRMDQVPSAVAKALHFGESLIVERYVRGRELTVAILGDEPLPVIEMQVPGEFFDYQAKYADERTREVCPAELAPAVTARAQATALVTHRALGCRDLSRVDMILDEQNLCWVLEANTLPGLTAKSLLPKAAAAAGLTFNEMCEYLLCRALERARTRTT
jgi:D-alanine-D-alanine ligase